MTNDNVETVSLAAARLMVDQAVDAALAMAEKVARDLISTIDDPIWNDRDLGRHDAADDIADTIAALRTTPVTLFGYKAGG